MEESKMLEMLQHADASGRVNYQVFKKVLMQGFKSSSSSPTAQLVSIGSKVAGDGLGEKSVYASHYVKGKKEKQ